jgi:hypothetical protein
VEVRMEDTRRDVTSSVIITAAAVGAIFVVGNLAHLSSAGYSFGILALLSGVFLALLALWLGNRTPLRRGNVVTSLSQIANGVLGFCLAAWLWTGFSGQLVVAVGVLLAVLSTLSIATGFWLMRAT